MNISVRDTSILAMLSRYPDMPAEEADMHISKIEHEENIPLCHAVLGRISPDELTPDAKRTYEEFTRWSEDRTRRFRAERIRRRSADRPDHIASRLLEMRNQGLIPEEMLLLYGISGDLPSPESYRSMSISERSELWRSRMRLTFGRDWNENFADLPRIFIENPMHDWLKDGF